MLARVGKRAREMDVLNMLPQISTILATLSTDGAFMQVWHLCIFDYVLIEEQFIVT